MAVDGGGIKCGLGCIGRGFCSSPPPTASRSIELECVSTYFTSVDFVSSVSKILVSVVGESVKTCEREEAKFNRCMTRC